MMFRNSILNVTGAISKKDCRLKTITLKTGGGNIKMKKLFDGFYDAAKWGVSDFYEDCEKALKDAIEAGEPFDTGWYSVKKEIQTGRVRYNGETITCEASCSDDFDTPGHGEATAKIGESTEETFDNIVAALDTAIDEADENRKDNQVYIGYAIGKIDENGERTNWIETYIQPVEAGLFLNTPPGDYYYKWGWQEEAKEIPQKIRKAFKKFIEETYGAESAICGGWRIDPWDGDDNAPAKGIKLT
jgi:hypothetical protein